VGTGLEMQRHPPPHAIPLLRSSKSSLVGGHPRRKMHGRNQPRNWLGILCQRILPDSWALLAGKTRHVARRRFFQDRCQRLRRFSFVVAHIGEC
jgi:hypothetical protein